MFRNLEISLLITSDTQTSLSVSPEKYMPTSSKPGTETFILLYKTLTQYTATNLFTSLFLIPNFLKVYS